MDFLVLLNEKIMQFAIGDTYMYVKFTDDKNFKNWYKALSPDFKKMVDTFKSSDLNIIIKNCSVESNLYKIAQEPAPGRYQNDIVVPTNVVELTGHSIKNPPPHPKSWYYDNKEQIKPVELKDPTNGNKEIELQTRKSSPGKGKKDKKTNTVLKESVDVTKLPEEDQLMESYLIELE